MKLNLLKIKIFLSVILLCLAVGCAAKRTYSIVDRRSNENSDVEKFYKHEHEYIKSRRAVAVKRLEEKLDGLKNKVEIETIKDELKELNKLFDESNPVNTIGMAFSGGGIRSSTFNLGVLQAMEAAKYLSHIDYLTTVSGGSYIGAWYVSHLLPHSEEDRKDRYGIACRFKRS